MIVFSFQKLQAPQVGTELLKLEGELHVLVGLVTVEQRHVALSDPTALQLLFGNKIDPEVFDVRLLSGACLDSGTHNVHFVPDLGV